MTWSRIPKERGLAAVGQGERGWILKRDGERIATVDVLYRNWSRVKTGYYFYARAGLVSINTAARQDPPFETAEEAKAACRKWVVEKFAEGSRRGAR